MPIEVVNPGQGNVATIHPDFVGGGRIVFKGDNNRVSIGSACSSEDLDIKVYGGSSLTIVGNNRLDNLIVYAARGARISIGANTIFNGQVRLLAHEAAELSIGEACLFGLGVDVMVSDMHAIVDAAGSRTNPAKDVKIADRVWVCEHVTILKGSTIGANSIIGARAVVSCQLPNNCLAVGNPAKPRKKEVNWRPELDW